VIFSLRGLPGGPREGPGGAPEGRQPGPLGNRGGGAENVCIYKQILKSLWIILPVRDKAGPGAGTGGDQGGPGGLRFLNFSENGDF